MTESGLIRGALVAAVPFVMAAIVMAPIVTAPIMTALAQSQTPTESPAQSPTQALAQPVEPIGGILGAFRTHPVVALGEDHGNETEHVFLRALVRDPRFAATVNDIVVEFGNARYQDLMDRFMKGEQVADDALRRVWRDTSQITGVWDRPIYEEFYRAVRAVNATLPRERQLRVVLGDLPLDWDAAQRTPPTPGQKRLYGQPVPDNAPEGFLNRDRHAADVVRREVLAKQRRALVIYGDMHLTRRPTSIVGRLESDPGVRVFSIKTATRRAYDTLITLQPGASTWPVPSLALVAGSALAEREFSDFDALLSLGPASAMTTSRLPQALCDDASYIKMRRERMALAGVPSAEADRLMSRDCPTAAPK
jgi:uncharacterized iron-regulated protein